MCIYPHYIFRRFSSHGDFTIILFKSSTQHEEHLSKTLFILTHLHILHPIIITHLTWVFFSFAIDMHIVGHALDVVLAFL
jgi:hypothetical protein